jgi:hypothetical protein
MLLSIFEKSLKAGFGASICSLCLMQGAGAETAIAEALDSGSNTAEEIQEITPVYQLDQPDVIPSKIQASSSEASTVEQVTSVTQLSDVQPADWAYQALQSLVERYGCIVGYPDSSFRGNRSSTRFELAAAVNSCLGVIEDRFATKEDVALLRKLAEEFAAELATIRGRVDNLEARTAQLETSQFSTTTKLTGQMFMNLTGAFADGKVTAERGLPDNAFAPPRRDRATLQPSRFERGNPNITFSYYGFLNLNTSFSGKDSLTIQLATGNASSPANNFVSAGFFNSWGTPFLDQSGNLFPGGIVLREFFYSFPATKDLQIVVGPRVNWYRYFDGNRFTFFLNGATSYNSNGSTLTNAVDRGSGGVAIWKINSKLMFTMGYLGENTEFLNPNTFNTSSNPRAGLFDSTYTLTGELVYSPTKNANLRFLYTRARLKAYNGFIGGAVGEPLPYGYADDGFGGRVEDANSDTFVFNFDWLVTKNFGLFGRYSYGRVGINPVNPNRSGGDVTVQSIQFGMGFPDVGKKGALGVISFLVPHDYLSGRRFLLSGGGNGATQYELEASYYFPITSNIAIIPAFYAIFNPNSFDSNPTVYVTNFRTQFTF